MTRMVWGRDDALGAQNALSEAELAALVERCPAEHRWAFAGWLRGERSLDGDLLSGGSDSESGIG